MSRRNSRGSDYVLRLKLDAATLERDYPKVFAKMQRAQARQAAAARRDTQASARSTREQISLMRQQERLAARIAQAERQGTPGIGRYHQMSRSTRPEVLARADVGLARANRLRAAEIQEVERANAERQRTVSILQQQERLQARIQRAEQSGARNLDRFRRLAESNDPNRLRSANTRLSRSLRNSRGVGGAEQLSVDIQGAQRRAYSVGPQFQDQLQGSLGRLNEIGDRLRTARTTRQVRELRQEYAEVRSEIRGIEREQERYNRTVARSNMLVSRFSSSIRHMGLQFASAYAVAGAASAAFNVGKNMDSMKAGMLAASGSAEDAAENFQFLKDSAMKLGTDIETGVSSFNRMAVAARASGLSTDEARHVYLAAAEASTTFGLSQDKQQLVMLGFSQMMSKGKISMEELSRQLGEHLPIAMAAATKATGKSTAETIKLIESGKLLSKDFMVPFATAMRGMVRENGAFDASLTKLNASMGRMKNSLKFVVSEVFDEGGAKSAGKVFDSLTSIIQKSAPYLKIVFTNIASTVQVIIDTLSVLSDVLGLTSDAIGDNANKVGMGYRSYAAMASVLQGVIGTIYALLYALNELDEWYENAMGKEWNIMNHLTTSPLLMGIEKLDSILGNGPASGASPDGSRSVGDITINAGSADAEETFNIFSQRIYENMGF